MTENGNSGNSIMSTGNISVPETPHTPFTPKGHDSEKDLYDLDLKVTPIKFSSSDKVHEYTTP